MARLVLSLLVSSALVMAVLGRTQKLDFMPAGVTSQPEDSPIDKEATQALPQAWVAYGWAKHNDGHCSYKSYRSKYCPDREVDFWEHLTPKPHPCPPVFCPPDRCIAYNQPCLIATNAAQRTLVNPCCDGLTCGPVPTTAAPTTGLPPTTVAPTTAPPTTAPPTTPAPTTPAPTTASPTSPPPPGRIANILSPSGLWTHVTGYFAPQQTSATFETATCIRLE